MPEIQLFQGETPDNFNTRCLLVLVLDTSTSMAGGPIDSLNKGLVNFGTYLKEKNSTRYAVEVCIIIFNSTVECVQEPALVDKMEATGKFPLTVAGTTKLVDGMKAAIKKVEERKLWYRQNGVPFFRPWILLMTDGAPDSDQDINGLADEIKMGHKGKHFAFLPMGVEKADFNLLSRISTPEFPPLPINWKKFDELFKWLSNSLEAVGKSSDGKDAKFGSIDDFKNTGYGGGNFTQTSV